LAKLQAAPRVLYARLDAMKARHLRLVTPVREAVAPPSVRQLAHMLRGANSVDLGRGWRAGLALRAVAGRSRWSLVSEGEPGARGSELIPGNSKRFDAVAAARRLLAAVRDAG
jgi:hypothetical protein